MKTQIFSEAISKRNQIKFLYGFDEVVLDPYYITKDKLGKKGIYGRATNSSEIKKFEYGSITNIKVFSNKRFSPRIQMMSGINKKNEVQDDRAIKTKGCRFFS